MELVLPLLHPRVQRLRAGPTVMRTLALLGSIVVGLLAAPAAVEAQLTDQALGERVADSVRNYAKFSIFDDVDIHVDNRHVTLQGRVTIPLKRKEIEDRVRRIDGIRELTNDIGVLPVSQTDDRLRRVVANAIYNHPNFWRYAERPNPSIHIIIEHQRVTLTGVVDNQGDRILAQSLAQVGGVLSVENRLRVGMR